MVPRYLLENGYDIVPVNPAADEILGLRCYDMISDVGQADIVEVFRPSADVPDVVREAIKIRPKVIWLQEGIRSLEAERLADDAGIDMVFNRCMLVEHRRLF